ncbi:MAG: thiopurine S-methyltransferase [Pseudomonadota bacterium]
MEPEFWHGRWEREEIAFHEGDANQLLADYFERLRLEEKSRIFVPLCGKAYDLWWIAEQGHEVVGIELNESAVADFFRSHELEHTVSNLPTLVCYESDGIRIYVGDFFDLTRQALGSIDAIYDRAALVALPEDMRPRYAEHLTSITATAQQFLVTFDYDQSQTAGPPFSVTRDEIADLYGESYSAELVASIDISGPLAGRCSGEENAWLLTRK